MAISLARDQVIKHILEGLDDTQDQIDEITASKTYCVDSLDTLPHRDLTYYLDNGCKYFRMSVYGNRCLLIDVKIGMNTNVTHYSTKEYLFSTTVGYNWVSTTNKHIIDKVYQHEDEEDNKLICYTLCIDSTGVYVEIQNIRDSESEITWNYAVDTYFSGVVNLEADETLTNGMEHMGEEDIDYDDEADDTNYYTATIAKSSKYNHWEIDCSSITGIDLSKYDTPIGYHMITGEGEMYEYGSGGTYMSWSDNVLDLWSNISYSGSDYANKYQFLAFITSSTAASSIFILGRFTEGDTCYICTKTAFLNMAPLSVAYGYDPKYIPYTFDTWNQTDDTPKTYPSFTVTKVSNDSWNVDIADTGFSDYTAQLFYKVSPSNGNRVLTYRGTSYLKQSGSVVNVDIAGSRYADTDYENNYHILVEMTKDDAKAWLVFRTVVDGDTGYALTDDELNNDYPLCVAMSYNPRYIDYPINATTSG